MAETKFEMVKLDKLHEAPFNPRQTYDVTQLAELVASIKEKGVISPLFVRPRAAGGFEIIGGSRRYRAAKKAGLSEVPCQIRELTDDDALEIAVVDNLQRADVSAIEEAAGYQELCKRGHTARELAAKVGKSERYIYARMELQKLCPKVRAAVEKGDLPPSHAQIIARLDKNEDQEAALNACNVESYPVDPVETIIEVDGDLTGIISVRDLERTVSAIKLGAELVDQLTALELAGHKAYLIGEQQWSYNAKQILSRRRWKAQGKKPCKFPAKGVLVDGKRKGKILDICATTNCPRHFKNHPVSNRRGASRHEDWQKKQEREQAARAVREAREKKIRDEVWRQMKAPKRFERWLLSRLVKEAVGHSGPSLANIDKLREPQLIEQAVGAVCSDREELYYHAPKFYSVAKILKVNVKKITRDVDAAIKAEKVKAAK